MFSKSIYRTRELFFFSVALRPNADHGLLSLEVLDHTQRRTTIGRTPLDEWSARRRNLYQTTHNTHNKRTASLQNYCLLCCACHCVMLLSLCCSVVIMLYCYCVALLLFVLSYVLIVYTVPLPPGVNPIAVDKYINKHPCLRWDSKPTIPAGKRPLEPAQ